MTDSLRTIRLAAAVLYGVEGSIADRRVNRLFVEDDDRVKAWGCELPSGTIVVEWRREFFHEEDQTDHPVASQYRSVGDAEQATQGEVVFVDGDSDADS